MPTPPKRKPDSARRANRIIQQRTLLLLALLGIGTFRLLFAQLYKLQKMCIRDRLQSAEDHVEGRDDQSAESRDAQLAEGAVHGEENGRREDLREAARTDLELRGVENEEDADQLDADGNEVVPFQRLVHCLLYTSPRPRRRSRTRWR